MIEGDRTVIEPYCTKTVFFQFRGRRFEFALSQGLFSSAGIDQGTQFLLKVFSKSLGESPPPKKILDAGCGVGVIGICAAAAADCAVRCQDRDELARLITEHNARRNGIPRENLSAHTEPLLGGNPGDRWDMILSNIPAKAGAPVLEDFIQRSAGLLTPTGRGLVVVVNPLEKFFRSRLGTLIGEETGPGHTVFVYGPSELPSAPVVVSGRFLHDYPAYLRHRGEYSLADTGYTLDAVYGAPDFDTPSVAAQVGAKLLARLRLEFKNALVYEPSQGHFPVWLRTERPGAAYTLAGRNVLGLAACRHNLRDEARCQSVVDLDTHRDAFAGGYDLVAAFPEPVPQTDRLAAHWESLEALLAPHGAALFCASSAETERFDRKKPPAFIRLGDLKRSGFRAAAYRKRS